MYKRFKFDCHVLLPALNLEVQFDPNKFHLALDKKLCLAIKFSGTYQCHNNISSDQHYCNSG